MKTIIMTKVRRRFYAISLLTASAGLVFLFMLNGCNEKKTPDAQLEARLKALEAGAPGMGTIMSGVQLHFAKLYFAGKAQNWPLAEFELHEVEENMDRGVALRPEEHGTNLVGLNDAFKQTQLAALKTAAQNKDWSAFQSAYTEAVGVCNGCHEETARPFIVITVPAAPPVPNQQWETPVLSSEK
jgi:hypothetical protein